MQYRRLGNTDLRVSVVGIGTWQFGGEWGMDFTQEQADAILGRAGELGVNLIDTAECYGDHLSEEMCGVFLKSQKREDWVVATKFGHKYHSHFDRSQLWTATDVKIQLEDSLKALQTDYIDVYQFHSGTDDVFDNDELWTMLNKQVEAGKVRHLGISIGSNDNIHQTAKATEVGASVIQVIYNRIDKTPEERVFPSCEEQDLGVLARVPLASGYLSGKYKPGTIFEEKTDTRSRHDKDEVQAKLKEVQAIAENEVPEGVNMATWVLAWCLKHPAVTCVIPGCKNVAQVESNVAAADLLEDGHPQAV